MPFFSTPLVHGRVLGSMPKFTRANVRMASRPPRILIKRCTTKCTCCCHAWMNRSGGGLPPWSPPASGTGVTHWLRE